jgi:integrase
VASVFKPEGAKKYVILYFDETGKRRKKTGTTDRTVTERIARDIENRVALRREGVVDSKDEAYRDHDARPLADHIADWQSNLVSAGSTPKHAELAANRARRLVAVMLGLEIGLKNWRELAPKDRPGLPEKIAAAITPARLSDLSTERIQRAIGRLKDRGLSLQSCNHYRAAIRAFANWCFETHRTREHVLRGVKGFNAKEDRRHDRRTLSLDELRRLIDAAERGGEYQGVSGRLRALCYRTAAATGLRFSELVAWSPSHSTGRSPASSCRPRTRRTARPPSCPFPMTWLPI